MNPLKSLIPFWKIWTPLKYLTQKCTAFFCKYRYRYRIGIGRYEKCYISILSVSADMKIGFIGLYRYRPIRKKAYWSPTEILYLHFHVCSKSSNLLYIKLQNIQSWDLLETWELSKKFIKHCLSIEENSIHICPQICTLCKEYIV